MFGVANPAARAQVSPHRIYADELTIVGSMAILRSFAPAVDAVARHAETFARWSPSGVPLSDIAGALAVRSRRHDGENRCRAWVWTRSTLMTGSGAS